MSVLRQRLERLTDHAGLQWGAVALAWLVSALTFQLRPIMPIDETRYLSIAWEMWHSGQWWVAHMNGVPYADKPPLLFWLINLGWGVFGVNDWWPRLIMPLASLLGLFQLRRIALNLGYEARTARMALLVLMSMLMWWLYSATLMFDILLTTCLLGAVAALTGHGAPRRRAIGVTPWLALALLAKGPAILLSWLPILISLPLWRERPGRSTPLFWLATGAAIIVLLAWALSSAWVGGEAYAGNLLWHQSVDRLEQVADHARPFWWYLPVLPVLLLPWSLWLPALKLWRRHSPATPRRASRLLWCWTLVPLVLFSLVSGKQAHYLMPILPPLALLIADILTRSAPAQRRTLKVPAIALFATGALTLVVKMVGNAQLAAMFSLKGVWLLWGLATVAAVVQLKTTAAATVLALLTTTAMATMLTIMLAPLWPRMDTRQPAQLLSRIEQQGQPVVWYGRDYQASFQFAGRLTTALQTLDAHPTDLCRWRQQHPAGWVIGDSRQLPALYMPALAHRFPWRARTLLVMPVSALQIATPLFLCLDPL
ncbi:ArnT family glycosyltransferase [Kushneria phyllosphaerae]|uniref:Undecaprenyl phosphate-alpha-4-amino-4-deoxy-L-arabinose arabinosyl transferase n=1 Tax=Kushneria phyllosphaerae TaxID=2100822 RepID=A0A2R8CJC1_9GAMM|nr:glycosyltransferase family 39 protein [Kushneria phyllosphaerae]SPJ32985.1 Undecaprenyl phosphate-alpha-4-amino-4-deoxy-L-arabinose arabinosyl transferase [Kushneria phyllosphaerae]